VAGTRPEAIKIAPVVARMAADPELECSVVVTGQHREILDQVLKAFGLAPDQDLDLMRPGASLGSLTARAVRALGPAISRLHPDALLVQGDTTTAFAAALAAFYDRVPVVHIEAGLRTGDTSNPFPEEANRRLIAVVTALHLAPTAVARANLLAEGVDPSRVVVTGNTVVDALHAFLTRPAPPSPFPSGSRIVTVTTHRRENWGRPQHEVALAIRRVAGRHREVQFAVCLHPNPIVRSSLVPVLEGTPNVALLEPLDYGQMVHLLARSWCAVTDSGGIQEECTALGTPVLVLRETTERPEGVLAGAARLVGCDRSRIVRELDALLTRPTLRASMARSSSVFGDGRAAERTHLAVRRLVGLPQEAVEDYVPGRPPGASEAEEEEVA
jgi:UDP-N-acetylglucosamine 2-epimerase (non-hydrolysing)